MLYFIEYVLIIIFFHMLIVGVVDKSVVVDHPTAHCVPRQSTAFCLTLHGKLHMGEKFTQIIILII